MKNSGVIFTSFFCTFLFAGSISAISQEISVNSINVVSNALDVPVIEDADKFAFGTIASLADRKIVLNQFDASRAGEVQTGYIVDAESEFGDIDTFAQLKPGDNVALDYIEKNGQFVVTSLVKQDPEETTLTESRIN